MVYDSMELPVDFVQGIAYKLTRMYYDWLGTVRVPGSCQYACKLAFMVELLYKEV